MKTLKYMLLTILVIMVLFLIGPLAIGAIGGFLVIYILLRTLFDKDW